MPRMIVSIDGVVVREVQLTKERTTLGRRPYNDIAIDHLAVSGEHAVIHMDMASQGVEIEDLGSTNGTYVNAKAIKRQALRNGDTVELGKYKIRFVQRAEDRSYDKTSFAKLGNSGAAPLPAPAAKAAPAAPAPIAPTAPATPAAPALASASALIRVISGAAAGRTVALQKVVTTIGKPGVAIASITKRQQDFVLAHVEGPDMPQLNGALIGTTPVPLKNGDRLQLAGTEMRFEHG